MIVAIVNDIKSSSYINNEWSTPAIATGYSVSASSEQLGSNVRHAMLGTDAYNWNETEGENPVKEGSAWCAKKAQDGEWI